MAVTKSYGLTTDGGVVDLPGTVNSTDVLPDQTNNTGKYLTTDGNVASWGTVASSGGATEIRSTILTAPTGLKLIPGHRLLELATTTTFVTQADAKTNPPSGWTWKGGNSYTNLTSASVSNGSLTVTPSNSAYAVWDSNNTAAPILEREIPSTYYSALLRFRFTVGNINGNGVKFGFQQMVDGGNELNAFTQFELGGTGALIWRGGDTNPSWYTNDGTFNPLTGIWFHIVRNGANVDFWYNTANQTTPPTTGWVPTVTYGRTGTLYYNNVPYGIRNIARFAFTRSANPSPVYVVDYFEDSIGPDLLRNKTESWRPYLSANGYGYASGTDPVAAVADVQVSESATIDQSTLRTVLAAVTGTRAFDDATKVTWSVVRGNSPPAAGTYYAATDVVVEGSGPYVAVYAKFARGTAQTSVDLNAFRIPLGS